MAETSELGTLHRTVEQLRSCVGELRGRYGDVPAVRRLAGDVERLDLDIAELDLLPAPPPPVPAAPATVITDEPHDPSLWADADDEGIGGYRSGSAR